jgi:hypothetical protein
VGRAGQDVERVGPFVTRLTWQLTEGRTASWESRNARKRGALVLHDEDPSAAGRVSSADDLTLGRLRRLNGIAAVAFTIGGGLFALGAVLTQNGAVGATASASVYFVGGLFFNTGGYASLLQAINAPRNAEGAEAPVPQRWRWWSYEPMRIGWLSTFVLFAGTLVFGVNLLDSFLQGLTVHQINRLIWAPDLVGCTLFLISGHLAFEEICHRRWPCLRRRSLGWRIVAVNQLGSFLFLIAALAAFTRADTGSPVNVDIANWGTFAGAMCFVVGGVLQSFERP